MARSANITEGSIIKPLFYFFFPILLGTFFQQLYNTVDALIVGNFLGKDALAAVGGTTSTYLNLFTGFFVGLSSGATVMISQYYGSHNHKRISDTVHTSIALALISGFVLSIAGFLTARSSLIFLHVPYEILDLSLEYIYIYFGGLIIMLIYNMGCAILRAVGDSKRPLYFLILSCFVNIVLDILFVYIFNWGVKGAAFATVIAQLCAASMVMLALYKSDDALQFRFRQMRLDPNIAAAIFKIGLPAAIESILYSISNLVISAKINDYGVDVIAAYTAYGKIDAVFWMALQAFGISITTFVGQNFGAAKMDRVKKGINRWLLTALAVSIVLSALICLYAPQLLSIFNSDPSVLDYGYQIVLIIVPFWFTFVPIELISGSLRGMGNTLIPTLITAVGIIALRLIWVFSVGKIDLVWLFAVYPVTWSVTSVAFLVYYYSGMYKKGSLKFRNKNPGINQDFIYSFFTPKRYGKLPEHHQLHLKGEADGPTFPYPPVYLKLRIHAAAS